MTRIPDGCFDASAIASFDAAWHSGKLIIIATTQEGDAAGRQIACITPRDSFLASLGRVRKSAKRREFMRSLRNAIRSQLSQTRSLTPQTDKDFMDDLAILMAAKLSYGENILEGSGLFSLMLAVSPDENLPWDERGFLKEEDAGHG